MTELKLVVLAGAKEGTEIPLRKSKFIIGRSSECTLRAASDAISRRHCAILRTKEGWVVRDLGSRNGTYLNDGRIESPMPLSVGDEVRVGPLKFRVDEAAQRSPDSDAKSAETDRSIAADLPRDVPRSTKPSINDTAGAPSREARIGDSSATEDDISRWLIGAIDAMDADVTRETQALSLDDTTAISRAKPSRQAADADDAEDIAVVDEAELAPAEASDLDSADGKGDGDGSGGWKMFGFGKNKNAKKKPGKLPKRPDQGSKDSREAAADILREMTRRR
jgi:pSer/pThr/pTyr-binding forkhead associated (FHA) protein